MLQSKLWNDSLGLYTAYNTTTQQQVRDSGALVLLMCAESGLLDAVDPPTVCVSPTLCVHVGFSTVCVPADCS